MIKKEFIKTYCIGKYEKSTVVFGGKKKTFFTVFSYTMSRRELYTSLVRPSTDSGDLLSSK